MLSYLICILMVLTKAIGQNITIFDIPIFYHGPPILKTIKLNQEQWGIYYAKVDNFNANDSRIYPMRFLYNLQFATRDGPIIIHVGGEWEITPGWLSNSGQLYEMARENGAAVFYTEHRFYGWSMPTAELSTSSLKLLSSRQAMEDIKNFILWLKSSAYYAISKIVLFGCSYAASLVTWTKALNSNLITAIYASSGPLLAKDNMYEYMSVVTNVIQQTNQDCINLIRNATLEMEIIYDQTNGSQYLRNLFQMCPVQNQQEPYDKAAFFQMFAIKFGSNVQSNSGGLSTMCQTLLNSTGASSVEKFANYFKIGMQNNSCVPGDYANSKKVYEDTFFWNTYRPWFYQQCNEFGWFLTTNSSANQAFGNSTVIDFYYKLCQDVFANKLTNGKVHENVHNTNVLYGGKHPHVQNAVFIYGSIDPWAPMGLNNSLSEEAIVFRVDGGSHCSDMKAHSASDNESMMMAKLNSRALIKYWLSNP